MTFLRFLSLICILGVGAVQPLRVGTAASNAQSGLIRITRLPDLSQKRFPEIPPDGYDLVVLGSGPGGETAAVRASQLRARVAIVEVKSSFGGPTGLTSKAVREAAKQIVQAVDKIGGDRRRQINRLWRRNFPVLRSEAEALQAAESRKRLAKNEIDLFIGQAELIPPEVSLSETIAVRVCHPTQCAELPTKKICIATGSRPHRPSELSPGVPLPFKEGVVIDSTELGKLSDLPRSVAIIGGGVIAVEYATVLAKLGLGVTLMCGENEFLPFLESDMRAALRSRMSKDHVLFVDSVIEKISINEDNTALIELRPKPLQATKFKVDLVLFSGGRNANSEKLNCEGMGIELGKYGRIVVDSEGKTSHPHIFNPPEVLFELNLPANIVNNGTLHSVGDVTGSGLASQAAQQGRSVSETLFLSRYLNQASGLLKRSAPMEEVLDDDFFSEEDSSEFSTSFDELTSSKKKLQSSAPMTLWTFPEISSVGMSEDAIEKDSNVQCVTGRAYFRDLARGRLSGDPDGFLKLIAIAEGPGQHSLVGVHIMGEGANELIQLGSVLVNFGATLEQLSNTPFAAVTLSALYQMASDDALSKSPYTFNS